MPIHLFSHTPESIKSYFSNHDVKITIDESRRLLSHVVGRGNLNFELKRPLSKSLQKNLSEHCDFKLLTILERISDPVDQSVRYLFSSHDGSLIEAVRIPLHKPGYFSICLSSQVGCAMACDFCATGRLGFKRNLEAWEIVAQLWQIRAETEGKLSGVVFMGQGEPFHNYDNVIQAARVFSHPCGFQIRSDNITISTVGLVPQIQNYTREKHPYRLIVSLTTAIPEKRKTLLPVANAWSLQELATALGEYSKSRKDRVTLAWVLIHDFNTGRDEVEALKKLMQDTPFILNLIDVNDSRSQGYQRASESERKAFYHHLQELNVPIVRRYSVGNASDSACGMLAAKRAADVLSA